MAARPKPVQKMAAVHTPTPTPTQILHAFYTGLKHAPLLFPKIVLFGYRVGVAVWYVCWSMTQGTEFKPPSDQYIHWVSWGQSYFHTDLPHWTVVGIKWRKIKPCSSSCAYWTKCWA